MSSIRTQILDAAETAERHMAQHEIPIVEKQLSMLNSMILKARD
jgi:hypothetical protein